MSYELRYLFKKDLFIEEGIEKYNTVIERQKELKKEGKIAIIKKV